SSRDTARAVSQERRCRRRNPWGTRCGDERRESSGVMTRLQIVAGTVAVIFAATTAYAATPIPPSEHPSGCHPHGKALQAHQATNVLHGTSRRDLLRGGPSRDTVRGLKKADCVFGQAGRDTVQGGAGNDRLIGGDGLDNLIADKGGDRPRGGGGSEE